MFSRPSRVAVAAVLISTSVLVGGAIGVNHLTAAETNLADTSCPAVTTEAPGGVSVTVTCLVPTPAPVTETATETVTETATATATVTQTVTSSPTPTVTPTPTDPPVTATRQVCMSSPASQWQTRLNEVGRPGITGRRIFAQTLPDSGARSLAQDAVAAGMTPVISYKIPGFSLATLNSGGYDAAFRSEGTFLASLGVPVYATIWHEPSPDVSGANFQAIHRRLAPLLKSTNVKVGPILNTWVLDNPNNYAQFDGYLADDLIANGTWNYIGFDSYQSGDRPSEGTPGNNDLSTRYNTIVSHVAAHGGSNLPFVIGEYNAYELDNLQAIQNTILSNDRIAMACVFNSDVGSKGLVLAGPMLTSFKQFKANEKFKQ